MLKKYTIVWVLLIFALTACQPLLSVQKQEAAPVSAAAPTTATSAPQRVSASAGADAALAYQSRLVSIYQQDMPGIVTIRVYMEGNNESLGSGFVYDMDGHIVTNYHVVVDAEKIEVDFASGDKTYATVIGTDPDSDLAVLKVNVPQEVLHPLPLGDSDTLQVGDVVIAIGNPFGLDGTMTVGVVSALGRILSSMHQAPGGSVFSAGDIIQTDAAINPGNSGGPLINLNGEVIGINRAIQTTSSTLMGEPTNSGVGFAVAINIVKQVVPHLIAEGKYDYPYVGISSLDDLSLPAVEALNLPQTTGAYVLKVMPGSPADKAGLRGGTLPTAYPGLMAGGDLIVAIDGHPIRRFEDLLRYLINHKTPGEEVIFTIMRDGEQMDITVELSRRPSK